MRYFPAAFETLTEQFARLPGIGSKTAQRLAFHVLSLPDDAAAEFASAILQAKKTIHTCPVCQNLTDEPVCSGTTGRSALWQSPRMSSPWSGPGSITGCTMCCTA